jgi:transposase
MRQKSSTPETPSERLVRDIRRATRKQHSAEEKIRIVLDGLRGEVTIAELCRREGILYYSWSKEFLEAGKRRLAGDTARSATTSEVKDLKRQALELKEVVAEQALELRLLKKSMTGARWISSAFCRARSIAGMIAIKLAASKRWPTSRRSHLGSGTAAFPTKSAAASSRWRSMNPSCLRANSRHASPISEASVYRVLEGPRSHHQPRFYRHQGGG